MMNFDASPSFVNRNKATSSRLRSGGIHIGIVTRIDGNQLYVRVPKFGGTAEYGPCLFSGINPSINDKVFVTFLDNQLSELVCLGTATRNAAPVDSPSLTGTPLAPTAPPATSTTQIATTEFVTEAINTYVPEQATQTTFGTIVGKISQEGFDSRYRNSDYPLLFDIDWNPTLKKLTVLNGLRWFELFANAAADITANGFVPVGSTIDISTYGTTGMYMLTTGVVSAVDDDSITLSSYDYISFSSGTNTVYYMSAQSTVAPGSNTLLGYNAGKDATAGYGNTIVGFDAGENVYGDKNTIVGSYSAPNANEFTLNTIVGHDSARDIVSGYGNTIIGAGTLGGSTTANQVTVIGYATGYGIPSEATAATVIGNNYSASEAGPFEILLGNGFSGTSVHISSYGQVRLPRQAAVYAYRTTNINLGDNQTIVFNATSTFNNFRNSGYNTSTGLFTAPVSGVYFVHAQILTQNDTSAADLRIAVNGARVDAYAGYAVNGGVLNTHKQGHVQGLVYVQANDTISIKTQGAINVYGASAGHTSLVIHLIG